MQKLYVKESVKLMRWNKHLPNPLIPCSEVTVHEDQSNVKEGFVRIKHKDSEGKEEGAVSIFDRSHFQEDKPESKNITDPDADKPRYH